jgi:hypothetical protein
MFPCEMWWDGRQDSRLQVVVALDHDALSQLPPRPAHRITEQTSFAPPRIQPPTQLVQSDNAHTDIVDTSNAPR